MFYIDNSLSLCENTVVLFYDLFFLPKKFGGNVYINPPCEVYLMRFDFYLHIEEVDVKSDPNSITVLWRITSKINLQRSSALLLSGLVNKRQIMVALSKELAEVVEKLVKGSGLPESEPDSYTTVFPLD